MAQTEPSFDAIQQPQRRKFLDAIVLAGGNLTRAARLAGMDRTNHYLWLEDDNYRAAYAVAKARATQMLEDEMVRRAYEGVKKPVFHSGKQAVAFVLDEDGNPVKGPDDKYVSTPAFIREYSDTLLIFALKALDPEKYRERYDVQQAVEHKGKVDHVVEIRQQILAAVEDLPAEARAIVARRLIAIDKPNGTGG